MENVIFPLAEEVIIEVFSKQKGEANAFWSEDKIPQRQIYT